MRSAYHFIYRLPAIYLLCFLHTAIFCQQLVFNNVNTSNGLSDNFIRSLAIDHKGVLWIGTNEGLNSYDGYSVTNYSQEEYPAIPSKVLFNIFCDSHNNIWLAGFGAAWADEKRVFHPVKLHDSISKFVCLEVFETEAYGVVLVTDHGQYYRNKQQWEKISWLPASITGERMIDLAVFDNHRLLYTTLNYVALIDYSNQKIKYFPYKGNESSCKASAETVAVADSKGHVAIVDINTEKIIREYNLGPVNNPVDNSGSWTEIRPAPSGKLVYGSFALGLVIVDSNGRFSHYVHEPNDVNSIAGNKVRRVLATAGGLLVAGTERYGVSICNIQKKQAGYKKKFSDSHGQFFDGYLNEMVLDKNNNFWFTAADRLIEWNKNTGRTEFYQYNPGKEIGTGKGNEIYRICIDKYDNTWVSIIGKGIAVFDKITKSFNLVKRDTNLNTSLKSNTVYDLYEDSKGKIWVASGSGFYRIDAYTKKIETFEKDSILVRLSHIATHGFAEDSKGRIWISTGGSGVWCYDPKKRTTKHFASKDGLLDDNCLDVMMDSKDNLYIAMYTGFNIIKSDATIQSFTRKNGLRFDKADAFLEDNNGIIWISNAKCLLRFDPVTHKMDFFDERENLNNGGFKPTSSLKTNDGELFWGTQSGINYFYPDQLVNSHEQLNVNIHYVHAGDSTFTVNNYNKPARIDYKNNNLEFDFVAINLRGSHNIKYQFQLVELDKHWQEGTDIRQARYSSIPPGNYTFKVRATEDRIHWFNAANDFQFSIVAPFYMQWWFKVSAGLLIAGIVYYFYRRRTKQLKQKKEELETEQVINYFAGSMLEYKPVDDALTDVVRNCIDRLHFENCAIYLLNETGNRLLLKATHSASHRPGKKVAQAVAFPAEKLPEDILSQTANTSHQFKHDHVKENGSEISVPIISNKRVLGTIDCRHSKKRFFTQRHLSILPTIASLCASKIIRANTEAEKKQAETMLADTKQKMAEAEMQALRAQMNPHFIFNCLNSINRYIVKSDQATASLYLTRFAKLIRLILDNSHSKNVILANEVEALRLYVEMESLRFENKFTCDIHVDKNVSADCIEVPPLIIQPYIENAIWHGLLHKTTEGHLQINISLLSDNMLQCIIEDNGVGREQAAVLKSKSVIKKKSLGMELTENRLLLLNQYASVHSSVIIKDLTNAEGLACGTKVILNIPFGDI